MAASESGISPEELERIARAIHQRYLRNQRGRKPPEDPSLQPWESLAEALRDSNRAQARGIPEKARVLGYRIGRSEGEPVRSFGGEELERLARLEHDRWVAERIGAGWTLGPVKDVERKRTPYLVSWEELAEEVREYDREAVRAIPEVLEAAGLGLFRS